MPRKNGQNRITSNGGSRPLVGIHLRAARIQNGLTQKELARRCGLTQTDLSKIEEGHRQPSFLQVIQFARTLQVPLEWFLSGRLRPELDRKIVLLQLQHLGAVDLLTDAEYITGAFHPAEHVVAWSLSGNAPDPRIVEAIPAVLAWNSWNTRLLEAYATADDPRACHRIAWLADVALTIHRSHGFPGGFATPFAFEELLRRTPPPQVPDDLGRPFLEGALSPVFKRWNIRYASDLEAFHQRALHLFAWRSRKAINKTNNTAGGL